MLPARLGVEQYVDGTKEGAHADSSLTDLMLAGLNSADGLCLKALERVESPLRCRSPDEHAPAPDCRLVNAGQGRVRETLAALMAVCRAAQLRSSRSPRTASPERKPCSAPPTPGEAFPCVADTLAGISFRELHDDKVGCSLSSLFFACRLYCFKHVETLQGFREFLELRDPLLTSRALGLRC